ncbi:cell division protein BolA [Cellvibrio japonicus Ueda107]|uniref:DNA-binding transcriptional regulator BolA n=2 Tax=Cellvibrio japonicus TaxID=155077 RepID=B3PJ91_CELJU|nr:cell division protein BolA [Cellvibrio japonicus Ueda107]
MFRWICDLNKSLVMKPVETSIVSKLQATFEPLYLQVLNESHMHSVPPGSESHFKVVISSNQFEGKRQVQRHQAIYACLADELKQGVHALALHTYSPGEWVQAQVPDSPQCLGGSKHG